MNYAIKGKEVGVGSSNLFSRRRLESVSSPGSRGEIGSCPGSNLRKQCGAQAAKRNPDPDGMNKNFLSHAQRKQA